MPVVLGPSFGGGGTWGGGGIYGGEQQTLQIFDETGTNPLPAGIFVTVNLDPSGTFVGEAWTSPGGYCNVALPANTPCIASFSFSRQAPSATVEFTPDAASATYSISVTPYRSPSLSSVGYTLFQMAKLIRGWYSDAAKVPGGTAYAIGNALAAGLEDCDGQAQTNLQSLRLQSSAGPQIDSWSYDMVGPMFGRYPQESDLLFIARNEIMVSRPRCTIAAIQAFVEAFYASILAGWSITGNEALGFDTAGGLDISGGLNTAPTLQIPKQVPPILVWDAMTQPALAAQYRYLGNPIQAPEFVIQIGLITQNLQEQLAYDTAGGFDTQGGMTNNATQGSTPIPTATAPDPRLGTMINLIAKAGGTVPLYLIGQL